MVATIGLVFKLITDNLNYHPSIGNIMEVCSYLLKLHKHKHGI